MHTTNETTPRPHGMSGQILTLLRAAVRIASTDETRPHLAAVRLSSDGSTVLAAATDGHSAVMVGADAPADAPPFVHLYSAKAIRNALRVAKGKHATASVDAAGRLTMTDGAAATATVDALAGYEQSPMAQVYPRADRMVPAASFWTFNGSYIAEHADLHASVTGRAGRGGVALSFSGAKDPAVMVSEGDGFRVASVIMPIRSDLGIGAIEALRAAYAGARNVAIEAKGAAE